MKLEKYNKAWLLEYQKIQAYVEQSLAIGKINHGGLSAIEGLSSLPIIDVHITIPSINDLPLVNDSLILSNYHCLGLIDKGKYYYNNNTIDFFPHIIFVIIEDSLANKKERLFKELIAKEPTLIKEFQTYLEKILIGDVSLEYYYRIIDYFINTKLSLQNLIDKLIPILYPDFNNSIYNITESLKKHYLVNYTKKTIDILDQELQAKKQVFFVLIDGLGLNILNYHLPVNSFLRKNLKEKLTSIFPSTTVAATTTLETGKLPGKTGWIGWQQYFPSINRHVVMFNNCDYYTEEKLSNFNTKEELAVESVFDSFENTIVKMLWPSFRSEGFSSFAAMIDEAIGIAKETEPHFTYLYWDELDHYLHDYGCFHPKVGKILLKIDQELARLYENINSQTTIIITADHGLIDIKPIYLNRFKELTSHFRYKPALEGRAAAFYVNNKEGFKELFERYFGAYFLLLSKEEFIEKGLLGTISKENIGFIGDFMAIAIDEYSFITNTSEESFKAAHAGLTSFEMLVPLIISSKN